MTFWPDIAPEDGDKLLLLTTGRPWHGAGKLWQKCSERDMCGARLRTQMPPRQLRSPEGEETSDEFVEAELEMLAMGARNIPQGTALGARALHAGASAS